MLSRDSEIAPTEDTQSNRTCYRKSKSKGRYMIILVILPRSPARLQCSHTGPGILVFIELAICKEL